MTSHPNEEELRLLRRYEAEYAELTEEMQRISKRRTSLGIAIQGITGLISSEAAAEAAERQRAAANAAVEHRLMAESGTFKMVVGSNAERALDDNISVIEAAAGVLQKVKHELGAMELHNLLASEGYRTSYQTLYKSLRRYSDRARLIYQDGEKFGLMSWRKVVNVPKAP